MKSDFDTGFPVNRMAFDHMLQDPYEGGVGYLLSALEEATGETSELMVYWPSGEELECMSAWVEKLTARADTDVVVRDAVLEQTYRCLCGEIGAEEAVNAMMQKINLYLSE